MEHIVFNARTSNLYYVKYPMASHLDFVATSNQSLIDGLLRFKHSYNPSIYSIDLWRKLPKFTRLNKKSVELLMKEYK